LNNPQFRQNAKKRLDPAATGFGNPKKPDIAILMRRILGRWSWVRTLSIIGAGPTS